MTGKSVLDNDVAAWHWRDPACRTHKIETRRELARVRPRHRRRRIALRLEKIFPVREDHERRSQASQEKRRILLHLLEVAGANDREIHPPLIGAGEGRQHDVRRPGCGVLVEHAKHWPTASVQQIDDVRYRLATAPS